ncbi:hypothetical protein RQP46_004767 [Phenoliferia psychrophenolica]
MFAKLLAPPARLHVQLEQQAVFTYPTLLQPLTGPPAHESALRGLVKLELPTKRKLRSLFVVIRGENAKVAEVGRNGNEAWAHLKGVETDVTMERRLDFEVEGVEEMESGEHVFEFDFPIPHSTAASGPTRFLQTRHTVTASLEFATGRLTTVSSPSVRFWVVPLRNQPTEIPETFELSYEHNSTELGPLRIHLFSPQLTLGALIHGSLFIASPPSPLTITSIRLFLTSSHRVVPAHPDVDFPISHLADTGSSPTVSEFDSVNKVLDAGQEWHYKGIFVMPQCWPDHAEPTTLAGQDSRVNTTHKLSLQIRFKSTSASSIKATTISLPVVVDSCVSMDESHRLPPYTEIPPDTEVRKILDIYARIDSLETLDPCPETNEAFASFTRAGEAEGRLEAHWSKLLVTSTNESRSWLSYFSGRKEPVALSRFPYLANYAALVRLEAGLLKAVGATLHQVIFIGSGPLPLSSILLGRDHIEPAGVRGWEITSVDLDSDALVAGATLTSAALASTLSRPAGKPTIECKYGSGNFAFLAESALNLKPALIASAGVVMLAALVGMTKGAKLEIALHLISSMSTPNWLRRRESKERRWNW